MQLVHTEEVTGSIPVSPTGIEPGQKLIGQTSSFLRDGVFVLLGGIWEINFRGPVVEEGVAFRREASRPSSNGTGKCRRWRRIRATTPPSGSGGQPLVSHPRGCVSVKAAHARNLMAKMLLSEYLGDAFGAVPFSNGIGRVGRTLQVRGR